MYKNSIIHKKENLTKKLPSFSIQKNWYSTKVNLEIIIVLYTTLIAESLLKKVLPFYKD